MRSRSAPGSSRPTSRPTDRFRRRSLLAALILVPFAALYVVAAFTAGDPLLRIALRCLPVLPAAVWTLWFDASRPLQRQPHTLRLAGRVALLILVMAVAVALLGLGLNWIDDPNRVL